MTDQFLSFMGGAAAMFFAMHAAGASDLDPEWLYWLLAAVTAVFTGAIELWRQRGVESKITDLESKIADVRQGRARVQDSGFEGRGHVSRQAVAREQ